MPCFHIQSEGHFYSVQPEGNFRKAGIKRRIIDAWHSPDCSMTTKWPKKSHSLNRPLLTKYHSPTRKPSRKTLKKRWSSIMLSFLRSLLAAQKQMCWTKLYRLKHRYLILFSNDSSEYRQYEFVIPVNTAYYSHNIPLVEKKLLWKITGYLVSRMSPGALDCSRSGAWLSTLVI